MADSEETPSAPPQTAPTPDGVAPPPGGAAPAAGPTDDPVPASSPEASAATPPHASPAERAEGVSPEPAEDFTAETLYGGPEHPARKRRLQSRRRWWVVLVIAVLVILALVAWLVVIPAWRHAQIQEQTQQEADAAAADFTAQAARWQTTFSAVNLAPYQGYEFSTAVAEVSLGNLGALGDVCANASNLVASGPSFSAPVPVLQTVEGGEISEEYEAATQEQAQNQDRYQASVGFAELVSETLSQRLTLCGFLLERDRLTQEAREGRRALDAYLTRPMQSMEEGEFDGTVVQVTCEEPNGCLPPFDLAVRADYGNRFESVETAFDNGSAANYRANCPLANVAGYCQVMVDLHVAGATAIPPIADLYRTQSLAAEATVNGGQTVDPSPPMLAARSQRAFVLGRAQNNALKLLQGAGFAQEATAISQTAEAGQDRLNDRIEAILPPT